MNCFVISMSVYELFPNKYDRYDSIFMTQIGLPLSVTGYTSYRKIIFTFGKVRFSFCMAQVFPVLIKIFMQPISLVKLQI